MTNYYVKFDTDGTQIETRLGLDAENPTGWLDTGLSDITSKQFKLVNGQAVALSEAELAEKYRNLAVSTALKTVRLYRDFLLAQCDWTQGPDSPLSAELKASWATYRQALRDLPSTVDSNGGFTMPVPPDPSFNPLNL